MGGVWAELPAREIPGISEQQREIKQMTIYPLVKTTAGTAVATALSCVDGRQTANKVRIQAHSSNAGSIWLGTSANMTKDTAIAELTPGATEWIGDETYGNVVSIPSLFVLRDAAGEATDSVLGAAFVR